MLCQLSYGGSAGATRWPDESTPRAEGPGTRLAEGGTVPATGTVTVVHRPFNLEVPVAKLSFLAGFGAGYVLGSRAGRERYEQIRRTWEHAKDDPRLQSLAGMAQAKADDAVSTLKAQLGGEPPR
jgi:hypothetical protein